MEFTVSGAKVHAATGGRRFDAKSRVLIFLHGAGMDHTCWQLPARWFAWHGFSALAVDLPAHGRSAGPQLGSIDELARWVVALMDTLGIASAALVGHSMGGAIALEAAARLEGRVTAIALLGTAAAVPVNEQLLSAARDRPHDAYEMMTAWALRPAAKIGRNPAPGMWMTGATLALFDRNTPGILYRDLALCNDWTTGPEAAKQVTCPTLVVTGKQDVMTPPRNGEKLAQAVAGSTTIALDDCGHMMMSEAPDALLDALRQFFVPRLSR